jgi:hypothetical protein
MAMANPIFSNIGRQPDGVHFNLTIMVNPKSISYEQLIAAQNPQPTQPTNTISNRADFAFRWHKRYATNSAGRPNRKQ